MLRTFIPHLFTLGNLLAGCAGLVFCLGERVVPVRLQEADAAGTEVLVTLGYSSPFYWSSFMIFLAAVLDFLDGLAARLLQVENQLGKALDSLADGVSFGVLPGAVLYQLLMISWSKEPEALYVPLIAGFPAFAVALAAAYRLARFNTMPAAQDFSGLPTPAMGLLVATFPLILFTNNLNLGAVVVNQWFLYGITAFLSWLMVSSVPMFSLKFAHYRWRGNELRYGYLVAASMLIASFAYAGIALALLGYMVINLVLYLAGRKIVKVN
ncbi:MAG: CDP-alcohol phosphatidyltransferase family protein [Chitinophagales bacterium]|nr:CDP-alcohol phosphatidyltransferase family protein [Chitinophagales bacterium]MDW8393127.1 CDP-alcohol phosphatidyltransferase family protein [Chitinophagales bacterium]